MLFRFFFFLLGGVGWVAVDDVSIIHQTLTCDIELLDV